MAFWTQADLDSLRAALASGVLMVVYAGPPQRSVTYQSLDAMRALLAEMRRDVEGSTSFRRVKVRRGFRDGNDLG